MNSKEKEQSLKLAEHYFRDNNYSFAQIILDKVIKIDPINSKANELLSYIYGNLGKFDHSFEFMKVACSQSNCSPEALYYFGSAQLKKGLFDQAIESFKQSISKGGEFFEALHNLATAQAHIGDLKSAINNYQKCLRFGNLSHELFYNIARIFDDLKQYEDAIAYYDKALGIKPDYAAAWSNKGLTLHELKRFDEAIAHYDKALDLNPDYAESWSNKGLTLHELKRFDEAIAHYDKALDLKPDYAEGWSNKAVTLHALKRFDEAIAHYDKALDLKPDYAEGWSNKGVTLHELKCYVEAITHYDKALSLKPDHHEASWNKSLSMLLHGDFERGLPLYESRWQVAKVSEIAGKRLFDKPTWLGKESLQHKTILLYGEQGFGDFIQFCRYGKLVADLGAKVILEVPKPLAGLMKALDGISQLVIKGEELPFIDYQCPLLSLPLALKTTLSNILANASYLAADPNKVAKWKLKLGERSKKRIGLVWSSMSSFKDDSKRSLMLIDLIKALPPERFEYICLQKELKDCDREFFESYKNIRFFGNELEDFSDTAALIENLDLVISTCTSVPHLSAALGKQTWILLSYVPDWRWLLGRDDSPWYPAVKLYRQLAIGDWSSVLNKVNLDLNGG